MLRLKTYDLFISHAWSYSSAYYKLIGLLNGSKNFHWRNYSVPCHAPLLDLKSEFSRRKLTNELSQQIRPVNCVLIIAGMYVAHRYWIQKEIDLAKDYSKPIIGVAPWGQERLPNTLIKASKIIVRWNSSSIVNAIRQYSI